MFSPPPVWFMDACWPQSMRNWSKELGRYCEWSCCRRRVNWKEGIEKTDVRRHQRVEERRARRKNSSSFPSSIIICAVCSARGDRHSRIGLHSYTSRCNTTTDWLGRASFVSRYFVFQLHVLGPDRTDRAVASPQTSFGVRSSRIQTPKDVYGETNGAEDWEGSFSSRGGMAVFADW